MRAMLAEAWHWQPSEIYDLDIDDIADCIEELTEIKGAQARAIRDAQNKR